MTKKQSKAKARVTEVPKRLKTLKKPAKKAKAAAPKAAPAPTLAKRGAGVKKAIVQDLVSRPEGATLSELMRATGWLAHSVRGLLSGTLKKKMGLLIHSAKSADGARTYSIAAK